MLNTLASRFNSSQLKHQNIFLVFLLLYGVIIFALSGSGSQLFERLHLMQDVSIGMLSLLLALFLLAEQSRLQPNVRKYLVIGFGFAAFTELLHAFVGIEWVGDFAWIASFSHTLRPTTWPPTTYVLPLALLWAIWLMWRNSALRPGIYAAGMALITISLYVVVFNLPPYLDTGLLGIQRPTQIPVLFLLLALIVSCWRARANSPLFEAMVWMGVFLFLSDVFMLYSTSPHEKLTMMSHAGKFIAYIFLHVIQMRLAAENSRARENAEDALKLEEQNLRHAMDELVFQQFALDQHSIVGTTDVQGNITYANSSFCNISGYSREELMGQNHRLLKSGVHPTEFFREIYRTIAAGNVWKGEICNRAKDGHLYWVMTTIVPVLDGEGKPKQYISLRTEITERKRVETELIRYRDNLEELVAEQILDLKQAKETAEAANRAKSEFLANMSHEIRTPMNGVVGIVDILQETSLSPAQQRMVDTIRTSSMALLGILGDILDLSKIEAGKLEIEFIPANLRELVESVAQVLSPTVADKNMDLIIFLSPTIPAWVRTDPGRLRQILFNLLSNAVKFTRSDANRRGRVLLRVGKETLPDGSDVLNFRVIDNGIGMTAESIGQLFQSFVQADATTTRRFGGTGLGLSISKHLAELLHGQIQVGSMLGIGTEFTLTLPLEIAPAGNTSVKLPDLSGLKVLLVTKNAVYQELLTAYMQAAGAQAIVVDNQAAALSAINQPGESGWVIFIDMTPASGLDKKTIDSIREPFPALPVVLMISRLGSASSGSKFVVFANPLLLDELVQAIALASGRYSVSDIIQHAEHRNQPRKKVPTIEEALAKDQLILVAEDNEINREVIQEQLRILGYASEAAEDGRIALEKWRSGRYCLLFTDCHMPNLDGFGLTAAIRKEEPKDKHIPIIAVTGIAMQGEAQRCLNSGMDDYLPKPLRLSDLGAKLAKWLAQQQDDVAAEPYSATRLRGDTTLGNADSQPPVATLQPEAVDVVWDATTLTRMVGDHPAMHRRLLDKFLVGAEEQVAAIVSAAAASDLVTVTGVAHKMKSAARTVGAMRLGRLCQELEISGRGGDTDAVNSLVAGLEKALLEAEDQINNSFTDER